ncbi:kinase-like protein [Linderina pennispora]|uniref:Kinase-like protein n=1 Tax=Linderina pennispora TaxID=61395 RepID=A0A1Y1W153_9FUNG|nr:kinase-like protein [Linderina pennispora]ORX67240.1 kinase-like protein [Linderina pennispora]
MTGLTLEQSELEVTQQHNLKRMLRRIRHARRTTRHSRLMKQEGKASDDQWDDIDDAGLSLRKMSVTMDIQDSPTAQELSRRVARLFNLVFEPLEAIAAKGVRVTRISGALTNCVYMVTLDPAPVASVHSSQVYTTFLRVYGTGVDEIISRDKELYWLSQLSSLGFGPRLATLTKTDIMETWTSKHIARRMCELHSLVSFYRPFGQHDQTDLPNVDLSGKPELWTNLDRWLMLVEQKRPQIAQVCKRDAQCTAILNDWPRLVGSLVPKIKALVDKARSPVVFAHDDLQYGNILRLHGTQELVVVDFEYAGYNYRGFDIANHFCEWMSDYNHPDAPHRLHEDMYPDPAQRHAFLRTYVKAKAFLDANMSADKSQLTNQQIDDEVQKLEAEIHPFVAASHLHWGRLGIFIASMDE